MRANRSDTGSGWENHLSEACRRGVCESLRSVESNKEEEVNQMQRSSRSWARRRGQSTLEYVLVFMVIVAAVIVIANTAMAPAVNKVITDSANVINNASNKLQVGLGL